MLQLRPAACRGKLPAEGHGHARTAIARIQGMTSQAWYTSRRRGITDHLLRHRDGDQCSTELFWPLDGLPLPRRLGAGATEARR